MEVVSLTPDGFPVYNNGTVAYVKDSKLYINVPALKILITQESDLTNLDVPIGSEAFLADETKKWRFGTDEQWHVYFEAQTTNEAEG
jgi:hypothetical protein